MITRDSIAYHPFYCEENVYKLAKQLVLSGIQSDSMTVLFFSGKGGSIQLFSQRVTGSPLIPVFWDYHVVLLHRKSSWNSQIYDADSYCPFPDLMIKWFEKTFPHQKELQLELCHVRSIPASEYLAEFSSDRLHMKNPDGRWIHPPPPWSAIQKGDIPLNSLIDFNSPGRYQPEPLDEFLKKI